MSNLAINKEYGNQREETKLFTYHQKSGYVGFIYAMIFVMILESVGVSFLLYKWSPILHWIHLVLGILTIIFLVFDLRAVVKNPIRIQENTLTLKIGSRPEYIVLIENVEDIKNGNINYENDKKSKDVLDLSLLGFDLPTFELVLKEPVESKGNFGNRKMIKRIFLTVDDEQSFYRLIKNKED
ncbi:hypothetical protein SM124_16700 [Bacillus sp. 31A1R]|uniref:Uncharacterized protein n=1 Tax=Robertmurraya mangrovi TaxID=3098077 RepID=A0ABU5J1R8_9BACI|nr:hypothetical protein [Bacillus sp. 31A1R]MDZ5473360.1 hypothetical protein [Bacillus sp. 31A1R]